MNLEDYISILEKQESLLHFSSFNRKEAWELGQLMVSAIMQKNLKLAASIRLSSGLVLFQHTPEGTTINNQRWMIRKSNVVRDWEVSSLHAILIFKKGNRSLHDFGLETKDYALRGGGFPIHVSGIGVIGAVAVSGQPHLEDHDFIVESLGRFLKVQGLPKFPTDADL